MYSIYRTSRYRKDLKIIAYNKKLVDEIGVVVVLLSENDTPLPEKYKDHQLKGRFAEFRECHVRPNWLLVYKKNKEELILALIRTGTHAELFK
ncbi:MAG: type II toxin-antitoxin system YafQ family toxin [Bacteroidales bacterium]|jgi:mRNA interferase YafQ|nr:type II toxin-antitoxin system YafQ family toxin [Bacteroidales bacterium]